MKSHNFLNQHLKRNYFEEVLPHFYRALDAPQFGMKFVSISLRRAKQMYKIMYNIILQKNNAKPSHFHEIIEIKDIYFLT